MTTIREYENEHGTGTSVHECETCGIEFTVTPKALNNGAGYENCLYPECDSYDPHRDVDILFMTDKEIYNNDLPVSIGMLQKRKEFRETGRLNDLFSTK